MWSNKEKGGNTFFSKKKRRETAWESVFILNARTALQVGGK